MASHVTPARTARLGRRLGTPADHDAARAAVLVLPSGPAVGTRHSSPLRAAAVWPLARHLARAGRAEGLVGHLVHYRYSGWNGAHVHPAEDAQWAVDEVVRRYGDIPVCLVGVGMGARAALWAAGRPAVESVVALAPWLPADPEPEPIEQLTDRRILIVHGTNDSVCEPEYSYRYALRLKKAHRDVCRFEVHSDGHSLFQHRAEVFALTADFVLGTPFEHGFSRPVTDALAAPPPLGLRMPLASGFGRSLRY